MYLKGRVTGGEGRDRERSFIADSLPEWPVWQELGGLPQGTGCLSVWAILCCFPRRAGRSWAGSGAARALGGAHMTAAVPALQSQLPPPRNLSSHFIFMHLLSTYCTLVFITFF